MNTKYFIPLLLLLFSCIALPETGQRKIFLTSVDEENKMGDDGYKDVLSKSKLANRPPDYPILQRVGSRIAKATGNLDFHWEYNLIESKELNAWCMPGGKIAVYTAILPYMKTEAGMAAVLGHEVAHAILRHSGQRMTEQLGTQLALGAIGMSVSNSPYKDQLLGAMGVGAAVGVMLPFSRTHETEADTVGLRYMAEAGYDPREALAFWERFSQATAGGGAPPEFLSTHPGGPTRIKNIKSKMKEAIALYQKAPQQSGAGENL